MQWRWFLPALALAGCGEFPYAGEAGPPAPVPVFHIGDRWSYHVEEGFRVRDVWTQTSEIVALNGAAVSLRVADRRPGAEHVRSERWSGPGRVLSGTMCDDTTREFKQPLDRFRFPMLPGDVWSQWLHNEHDAGMRGGSVNYYVRVGGWEQAITAAGRFDALHLRVYMILDDEDGARGPTHCTYQVWYAPQVRGVVREEREAYYYLKGPSLGLQRTQHGVIELTSFTPGA